MIDFNIILKKLNNSLSESEEVLFNEWYNESDRHRRYFKNVSENYGKDVELVDIQKAWSLVSGKIELEPRRVSYWKFAAAASIVLLISISLIFNYFIRETAPTSHVATAVIEPGKDKAILTLDDGSEIALEKGIVYKSATSASNGEQITYQSGEQNTHEVTYNYLTIPRGGQFFIKLADGTQVWLNSESKLKYPVSFVQGNPRTVELLYGEAYFDVSPSEANMGTAFRVAASGQEIEVLGTEFNVKAYADEASIYTTLVEGKVVLKANQQNKDLLPNQQAVVDKSSNSVLIRKVETKYEIAWKNGLFSFKGKPLKDIMKVLSRWYDVDVVFEDRAAEEIMFNGQLSKHQNIEDILNIIQNTNFIKSYEIDKNRITIKK